MSFNEQGVYIPDKRFFGTSIFVPGTTKHTIYERNILNQYGTAADGVFPDLPKSNPLQAYLDEKPRPSPRYTPMTNKILEQSQVFNQYNKDLGNIPPPSYGQNPIVSFKHPAPQPNTGIVKGSPFAIAEAIRRKNRPKTDNQYFNTKIQQGLKVRIKKGLPKPEQHIPGIIQGYGVSK